MVNSKERFSPFIYIATLLLIILFLYTGISKAYEYKLVKIQMSEITILKWAATPISILLPIIEIIIALLLAIPKWRYQGFLSSLILLVLFTIYIGYLLMLGGNLPCSCGGVIGLLSWQEHLIFNFFFIILSAGGLLLVKKVNKETNNKVQLGATKS